MAQHEQTLAIVGGGFSGTVLAARLLREGSLRALRVVLVERCAEIGGAAYATRSHPYLLNVPAGRMSADAAAPDSFLRFLRRRLPQASGQDFVPRAWYGDYLRELLEDAVRDAPAHTRFERRRAAVAGLERAAGRGLRLQLSDGGVLDADQVVLACGNPPPAQLAGLEAVLDHPHYVRDACRDRPGEGYTGEVLLIGTGLTMADTALAATESVGGGDVGASALGKPARGTVVHAISRHGLVPPSQVTGTHAASMAHSTQRLRGARSTRGLLQAARALSREAQEAGTDWRDVVNLLREHAPELWQSLGERERRRFLRHVRPYWDVHRHRLPPATHDRLTLLRESGRLHVHAGRILSAHPEGGRLRVTWRPRGEEAVRERVFDWIVNCTGPDYDARRSEDPLIQSLITSGLAQPDACGLGLRTGAQGALIDADGRASTDLYCLGPMLRADHWETTAVAELRVHAEALANHLAGSEPHSRAKRQELLMSSTAIQVTAPAQQNINPPQIDARVYALYDEYCHGHIDRREFLARARALVIGGVSALAMAQALFPRYAEAQTISFTDTRIKAKYVDYDSPGGNSGKMRGYLVQPAGTGPFPAVLVVHENRGLNPYIEDVARRLAVAGFLALAPDGLAPAGGYPGNDDDGRTLQSSLDQAKLRIDLLNSARYVKSHAASTGKLGATGFCFGGGIVNYLATAMGAELAAGVPFYGAAAALEEVPRIKAALLLQFAATDERINAMWTPYEAALKANKVTYEAFVYPGTQHGFHNNSTPRFDEAAAKLAEERTIAHFRKHLA